MEIIDAVQARLAPASQSDSEHENSNRHKRSSLSVGRMRQSRRVFHAPSLNDVLQDAVVRDDVVQVKVAECECRESSKTANNKILSSK